MSKYIVNDIVRLKKGHPCGSNEWKILRTGVDIKLECLGCNKVVWLSRVDFEKRVRKIKNEKGKFESIVNFERKTDME
ncbi:MAG: DUF951 domain-containing protein [Tissierellia bacterium]|nr:DUF951 domain-containing protein [Tissierellia bacterium]